MKFIIAIAGQVRRKKLNSDLLHIVSLRGKTNDGLSVYANDRRLIVIDDLQRLYLLESQRVKEGCYAIADRIVTEPDFDHNDQALVYNNKNRMYTVTQIREFYIEFA